MARGRGPSRRSIEGPTLVTSLLRYLLSPFTDPNRKRSSSGASVFALDGVRGFAVLIVIASHTDAFGMRGQGSLGVLLFFMLSGFVLTIPFAEHPERILDRPNVRTFFANRLLRIVPIFVIAVLCIAYQQQESWSWIFANLTFYSGWNHLWSVAEEARFYLLFPLAIALVALLPTRFMRILALIVMICVAWEYRDSHAISQMDGRFIGFYLWFFLTGILVCFVYGTLINGAATNNRYVNGISTFTALVVVLLVFASSNEMLNDTWRPLFPGLPTSLVLNGWGNPELWCGLLALFLLSVAAFPGSLVSLWMQTWPMRHLGLLSYSLYLFHVPVMGLLQPYGLQKGGLFVAVVATTYVAAIASYILVERPFLMLKAMASTALPILGQASKYKSPSGLRKSTDWKPRSEDRTVTVSDVHQLRL